VQNGLDRRSQQSRETTEVVEIHVQPVFSNGPVDTAVNNNLAVSKQENDTIVAVTHESLGIGNGDVSRTPPRAELQRDYDDDSGFPSPPVFTSSGGLAVVDAADGRSDDAADNSVIQAAVVSDLVRAETTAPVAASPVSAVLDVVPPAPQTFSGVSTSAAAPPPPAPPLPTSISTAIPPTTKTASSFPQRSVDNGAGPTAASVPPRPLPESSRRESNHDEALMAAVARRRSLLDSTDAEQMAKSIENKVRRNSKLQVVYRAGPNHSSEQHTTPVPPPTGLLTPVTEPDRPKVVENGKCLLNYYINVKNCSLYTVLTATDRKPQKS